MAYQLKGVFKVTMPSVKHQIIYLALSPFPFNKSLFLFNVPYGGMLPDLVSTARAQARQGITTPERLSF